jgi:hypothetical protein
MIDPTDRGFFHEQGASFEWKRDEIFVLTLANSGERIKNDGFVKSPSAALRGNFVVAAPKGPPSSLFARLASGAFYKAIVPTTFSEIVKNGFPEFSACPSKDGAPRKGSRRSPGFVNLPFQFFKILRIPSVPWVGRVLGKLNFLC